MSGRVYLEIGYFTLNPESAQNVKRPLDFVGNFGDRIFFALVFGLADALVFV
jgi:hypothetical protein